MDFTGFARLIDKSSARPKENHHHLPIPTKESSSAPTSPALSIIEDYSSEGSVSSSTSSILMNPPKRISLRVSDSSDLDPLSMNLMQKERDEEIFKMDHNSPPSKQLQIPDSSHDSLRSSEDSMYSTSPQPSSTTNLSTSNPNDPKKSLSTLANMFASPKKTHRRAWSQNSNSHLTSPSASSHHFTRVSPVKPINASSLSDLNVGEVKEIVDNKEEKQDKDERRRLTQSHSFTSSSNAPVKKIPSGSNLTLRPNDSSSMLSRLFGISNRNADSPNSEGKKSNMSSRNSSTSSLSKLEEEELLKESLKEALKESIEKSMKLSDSQTLTEEPKVESKITIYDPSHALWQREDRIGQLMLLVLFSFVLGYLRLPLISISVVFYFFYLIDRHRQLKWREEKKTRHKKQSDSSENKQKSESTKWLNVISATIFPHLSHNIAESTKNTLKSLLTSALEQRKPAVVESISVSHISYGNTPAVFSAIAGTRPPHTDFSFDLDLTYQGPLQIVVDVLLGGKFVNLRLPISIQDFNLAGRLRLDLSFFDKSPYLHTYKYSFLQLPNLTCSIKPMRGVNVLDFPFVESWIFDSMSYLIKSTCVLPSQISVPFHTNFIPAGEEAVKTVIVRETPKKVDVFSDSDSDSAETIPEDTFHSVLLLRIVEAKLNIRDKILEKSVPIFTVVNGADVINSTKQVLGNIRQPIWNELVQIAVKRDSTRVIEISIKAPVPTSPIMRLLGRTVLRLDSLTPDTTIDIWYPLTDDFRSDLGKVHVILRYLPPDAPG